METIDHSIKIAFFVRGFDGWRRDRCAVDGFVQDRVVGIMFLHRAEVVGAFQQMGALTAGVFRTNGLAIDALCRKTLCDNLL